MFHKIRDAQQGDREEGFTLIELLVVVIIIGILAAIAIPVFLNQREKARNSAANSDLRNAITAQESYFTEFDRYSATVDPLNTHGLSRSTGVMLCVSSYGTQNGSFRAQTYHPQGSGLYFYYDSATGQITKNATSNTSCGTYTAAP